MSRRRLLILCAGALAALSLLVAPAGAVSPKAHQPSLQFIGQAIIPTGTTFAGTTIGGLSSIAYDPKLNVYYTLSDDQSQINPARFYTVGIDVGPSFDSSDIHFEAVTTLQQPGGGPYPTGGLDPEGLALTKDRELILTSEGNTNTLLAPFVREYDLTGDYLGDLPVPGYYLPTADHSSGIRFNLAFEAAGVPPNGRFLFTATENALFQDGPAATPTNGSPSRILRYNLQNGRLDREYLYETDPIFEPPIPSTQFAVNGIVELLPFNNELMLSMERSFSVGVPGTGNEIKLYRRAAGCDERPGHAQPRREARLHPAGPEDAAARSRHARHPARQRRGHDVGAEAAGRPAVAGDGQRQQLRRVAVHAVLLFAVSP